MRRLLVISATLLALAATAAPAQAGIEAQFARYKPLADAAWEQYRCGNPDYPGAPAITAHLHATVDDQPALGGWGVLAFGSDQYCTIWFKDGIELTDAEACKLVIHEYGHLAGVHRSDDPSSIMFPRPGEVPYAPCDSGAPVQRVASPVAPVKADAPATKALRRRCPDGKRFMWGRCR